MADNAKCANFGCETIYAALSETRAHTSPHGLSTRLLSIKVVDVKVID